MKEDKEKKESRKEKMTREWIVAVKFSLHCERFIRTVFVYKRLCVYRHGKRTTWKGKLRPPTDLSGMTEPFVPFPLKWRARLAQ